MPYQMRNDNVLVEMIEEKHAFLTIKDEGYKWRKGKVINVGNTIAQANQAGFLNGENTQNLQAGQTVIYKGQEHPDFEVNKVKYVILTDADIKGIVLE